MNIDIIKYDDLLNKSDTTTRKTIEEILCQKGILGVRGVPDFEKTSLAFVNAARQFTALPETKKQQYAPDRDAGDTEGYELGAEQFKNEDGSWQIDDKKSSFYAFVPDKQQNKWPVEVDLKTSYLKLGQLIFNTGKLLLDAIGLNDCVGLDHQRLNGYGRMLHYHKVGNATNHSDWCGAHLDHGVFTGLMPAHYFNDGKEVEEPEEAGLFIVPSMSKDFVKIHVPDKSVLLFQVGEFGQLISNDRIRATRHLVKKAKGSIERYAFALFYSPDIEMTIKSTSILTKDSRYADNQTTDAQISYGQWEKASYARYRAL